MSVFMRYLLIVDAALFAMAGTLAIVLGVVLILYSVHTDLSARVGAEMPLLAAVMGSFAVLAVVCGAAFWSLLKQRSWCWRAQIVAGISVVLGSIHLYRLVTG